MSSTQQHETETAAGSGARFGFGPERYRRYLLWALLIPGILWVLAFPLVRSRSYEQWGQTQWGPVLDFPYRTDSPEADVVVFGDSSAFLGINPKLINAQLGIRSVVLPSTVGSLPVTGDAPLRSYLSRHRRPRLIVLYFSAWNLDFAHAAPGREFEGEEMMLRHGDGRDTLDYALHHPAEVLAFPIRLYSTFGPKMLLALLHHTHRSEEAAEALGHVPYLEPFPPLQDLCRIPRSYLEQQGQASVQALRQRYAQDGTKVMVYVAPIPDCTNSNAVRQRSFAALGAAAPQTLPPTSFAADPYYAHILPFAVPAASKLFATAVHTELQRIAPDLLHGAANTASTQPAHNQ